MNVQRLAILTALPLQFLAAASHAGSVTTASTTITVGPTPAPPPAAPDAGAMTPAVPVPVMDNLMLIVAGLLLAAIAIRFLRNSKGAQKLMSILVLGGSLTVAGLGTERTIAQAFTDFPIAPDCDGADISVSNAFAANQVVNDCDTAQDILAIETVTESFDECREAVLDTAGTCSEGATLEPGDSCTTDRYVDAFICGEP